MLRYKGFTLIELLVVIAIISLLSSIVLASLGTSRAKASDAAIKQGLVNLRSAAELYYSNNGNYGAGGGCGSGGSLFDPANTNIWNILLQITKDNGPSSVNTCLSTVGANGAWAVSSPLRTNSSLHWCVDSKQASRQITSVITSAVCPAT